ncbi:hypothetical protein OKW32_007935 [Paraburkholderia youngii]
MVFPWSGQFFTERAFFALSTVSRTGLSTCRKTPESAYAGNRKKVHRGVCPKL